MVCAIQNRHFDLKDSCWFCGSSDFDDECPCWSEWPQDNPWACKGNEVQPRDHRTFSCVKENTEVWSMGSTWTECEHRIQRAAILFIPCQLSRHRPNCSLIPPLSIIVIGDENCVSLWRNENWWDKRATPHINYEKTSRKQWLMELFILSFLCKKKCIESPGT